MSGYPTTGSNSARITTAHGHVTSPYDASTASAGEYFHFSFCFHRSFAIPQYMANIVIRKSNSLILKTGDLNLRKMNYMVIFD